MAQELFNGKETNRMLDYEERNLDLLRFDRAKIFIKRNNIILNKGYLSGLINNLGKRNNK